MRAAEAKITVLSQEISSGGASVCASRGSGAFWLCSGTSGFGGGGSGGAGGVVRGGSEQGERA